MSIGGVLSNIAVGLFTNALGDVAKSNSKAQNAVHKLLHGETLETTSAAQPSYTTGSSSSVFTFYYRSISIMHSHLRKSTWGI
ncbi:hypothetical protein [Priestia megaterium]|uniref:hypothetical protein n=1 Tax=Priestia megaterium TaxID=1404 RepID=UPI002079504E|nr:hypothetical protein [Priestia megaterium]USL34007.1 hypothetical protein LIT34_14370 [Priestia megaterium]